MSSSSQVGLQLPGRLAIEATLVIAAARWVDAGYAGSHGDEPSGKPTRDDARDGSKQNPLIREEAAG